MRAKAWLMTLDSNKPRTTLSWIFLGTLFALCGVLGFLQYREIGEVSTALRQRLRTSLQASLNRFSQDFNSEVRSATRAIAEFGNPFDPKPVETALPVLYTQWKSSTRHPQLFSRIAIAEPHGESLDLQFLDLNSGKLIPADWPANWLPLESRLRNMGHPEPPRDPHDGHEGFGPPPTREREGNVLEQPVFGAHPGFGRHEIAWVLFELNQPYVRDAVLPELLQRDLADYQVEIVNRANPAEIVYRSDTDIRSNADATVGLFEPQFDAFRAGPPRRGPETGPNPGPPPISGRWQMFVRHRAGSLETVVSRARVLNLAVTTVVLVLLLACAAALMRFTGRAQKLAEQQMGFVAGVSHELRTPLTVLHTAGYNLRGKMAHNPAQVERYGALIQQESARLKDLVEQVLRFAGAEAGRVIHEPEPLSVEAVIDETMASSKAVIEESDFVIEKKVEADLPLVLGDSLALKHALQNLLSNAAKYGTKGSNWIGIFASRIIDHGKTMVEIRVADRGPGIPEAEQDHIFDPFFRGQRAVQEQVHGTGLGLNLVKKIVEAHGGTIRVTSEPTKGAVFIVRLPEAAGAAL